MGIDVRGGGQSINAQHSHIPLVEIGSANVVKSGYLHRNKNKPVFPD